VGRFDTISIFFDFRSPIVIFCFFIYFRFLLIFFATRLLPYAFISISFQPYIFIFFDAMIADIAVFSCCCYYFDAVSRLSHDFLHMRFLFHTTLIIFRH